jgi:glycosyltransferase involved in cell wall biosynthesis
VIDRYIAISREILDKLLALLPHRKDQIRLAYFSTPAVPVRRAAGATGRLKLIYVSRLEDGKNPLMLPQINRLLKAEGLEVEWTIVGDGPLRAELEKEIGNNANFRLAGFLSATELSREYRRHDIFILPSGHEGIPVSLIEAMKTGLAPIVSDISGGIREIVTNGNNGFLCPLGDAAAFAATIGKLNADRGLLEAVCSMAADFADKTFDPASCAERYWSVIREAEVTAGPKDFSAAPPGMLDSRWLPNPVVRLIRTIQTKRT